MSECLTGLATAQDISLETSLDYLFNFIINNLGYTCLDYGPGKPRFTRLTEPGVSFFRRQEIIYVQDFSRTLTTKSSRSSSPVWICLNSPKKSCWLLSDELPSSLPQGSTAWISLRIGSLSTTSTTTRMTTVMIFFSSPSILRNCIVKARTV